MPKKDVVVRVCNDTTCTKKGPESIMRKIKEVFSDVEYCGCLGNCDFGPNVKVNNNIIIQGANQGTIIEEINKAAEKKAPTQEEKMANLDKALDEFDLI